MTQFAILANQLTKTYPQKRGWRRVQRGGGTQAVREIDLQVGVGELFGLLGPNGAGKTTLVKMLCTLILPSSGSAMVNGFGLEQESEIKREVGLVVTDERSFYWRLSARQNLMFFAAMHGLYGAEARSRVDETLDSVQLLGRADSVFSDFSSGMRQRMSIARGLLHRPKILFLDEPTRSLDPTATNSLHDLITEIRAERQMTVMLITHDLSEAEKLCNRVAVMSAGRVRGVGTASELRSLVNPARNYVIEVRELSAELSQSLQQLPQLTVDQNTVLLTGVTDDHLLNDVLARLVSQQADVLNIQSTEATLEQVFAALTT